MCSISNVQIMGYIMACMSCPFVYKLHHLIIIIFADLSEGIELLKFLSGICCRVCKIQSFLSIIFFMMNGAVCLQLTQFSCDDRENMYESR